MDHVRAGGRDLHGDLCQNSAFIVHTNEEDEAREPRELAGSSFARFLASQPLRDGCCLPNTFINLAAWENGRLGFLHPKSQV